jgi:solute carrier family 35 protein E1
LNLAYNILNKKVLKRVRLPVTLSAVQMLTGLAFLAPQYLLNLRPRPSVSSDEFKGLFPIGIAHAATHLAAVIALGTGTIHFTHIVKAAEPVFTALFGALFLGEIFPFPVYLTLIPVIGGVILASAGEINFSQPALLGAVGSNVAAATRAVLSKRKMAVPIGRNISPSNLYTLLTVIAGIVLVPLAAGLEGSQLLSKWSSIDGNTILYSLLSGLFYYLYNDVAFRTLDAVHPVTHAVGNTFKRVVIIFVSAAIFQTQISRQTVQGAAVAIAGVLVYSLTKQHYHKQKAFY